MSKREIVLLSVVGGFGLLVFGHLAISVVFAQDMSSLDVLELSHRSQSEAIQKMQDALCQTEIGIAKEKVRMHLANEAQFDNYTELTQKAIGNNLSCRLGKS